MKKFFIIIILLLIWTFGIEPNLLSLKRFYLKDTNLAGIKIVFISDLHLRKNQKQRLNKIVEKINQQKPDIVLSTGDFVNGTGCDNTLSPNEIAQGLSQIKSTYGIYTVLGNHDCCEDETGLINAFNNVGIKILNNENLYIKELSLYITGIVDDTTRIPDITKALKGTSIPRILLMHNPDTYQNLIQPVTLVCAGHNHGGQISIPLLGPLFLPAKTGRKYIAGLYDDGFKKMIVTKGIGTSILHARFNCCPEIVIIEFN